MILAIGNCNTGTRDRAWPDGSSAARWPNGRTSTPARSAGCSMPPSRSWGGVARGSRPRVADIVAAAGLSNEAFYRHFRSKDALVTAIFEDGGEHLRSYLAHQLAKEATPEAQVRRWVDGVLAQASGDIATTTLAVLWNGGSVGGGLAAGRHFANAPLASLLHEPFAALGSDAPEFDAALATHATLGKLSDCLWQGHEPTPFKGVPTTSPASASRAVRGRSDAAAGPPRR